MTQRIAFITGTRAEYGILRCVLDAATAHPDIDARLVVTGTHLTTTSVKDITHRIHGRVRMQRKDESGYDADVRALARGVEGFGRVFAALDPDAVVVLGDRVEMLAAATAASVGGRILVHLHGGDRAEGVADEAMRHAISKLAHLHFPATAQSRKRLVRMGEDPDMIHNVGSPAIDALRNINPDPDAPALIIMQHPVGASDEAERDWMDATLRATAKHDRLVFAPNHDPGANGIRQAIAEHDIEPIEHLPRGRFLALLAGARVIVGNSSAGLIEAAALRTASINIGPRQGGREAPRTVVPCDYGVAHVREALKRALKLDTSKLRHPYGKGDAGPRIIDTLASIDLRNVPRRKRNTF
ncbi:MAG: UDP-N-acetylglucosamine 2-epimerase [Phycisphaerales bacterium JB063]